MAPTRLIASSTKRLIVALLWLAMTSFPSFAQSTGAPEPDKQIEAVSSAKLQDDAENRVSEVLARAERSYQVLKKSLDMSRQRIETPDTTIEAIVDENSKLIKLQEKIVEASKRLKKPIEDFSARLAELGPNPKKGETEAELITEKRKSLGKITADLAAALKKLDLLSLETSQVSAKASEQQKNAFVKRVFVAQKSVLNPTLWAAFTPTISDMATRSLGVVKAWNKPSASDGKISGQLSYYLIFFIHLITIATVFFIWKKMANPPSRMGPANQLRRLWRAVGGSLTVGLIVFVGYAVSDTVLSFSTITDLRVFRFVEMTGTAIFVIAAMVTLFRAVTAPANGEWRLINIDQGPAKKLFRVGLLAALVLGIDGALTDLADIVFLPLEFVVGVHALTSIALIVLIAMMITVARNAEPLVDNPVAGESRAFFFGWASKLYLIVWIGVFAAVLSLLFGFVALAHFILTKLLITATLVVALYLVHHLVDALVNTSMMAHSRIGGMFRQKMGLEDKTIQRLGLVLSTITDIAVVAVGLPIVLSLWAITWIDLSAITSQAFFGFKVGDITVEPSKILLAIFIILGGVVAVRLFTLWLNKRILERSSFDSGVKNSIVTGAKYSGVLLVAGFALSAAGLDFSKLAIVAGALSVGIGFGLQSVVSNFVSGLILLAERPIRIGDWIEVGAGEGTVKQINVRSTEILTFDRCSVIIPNSAFISDPVKNWSHGSSVGRIKVNIGVGYNSDPEQVREILLKCANAHEEVVPNPAPKVMFMDFGSSSLDFQLRVFLYDIGDCTSVASDLRFAIFAALNKAGIEIPFPQRDINIRDADKIAEAFKPKPQKRPARKKAL
jgi:small-conductance mechanosensitive channel